MGESLFQVPSCNSRSSNNSRNSNNDNRSNFGPSQSAVQNDLRWGMDPLGPANPSGPKRKRPGTTSMDIDMLEEAVRGSDPEAAAEADNNLK